jgi:hypothetical protein
VHRNGGTHVGRVDRRDTFLLAPTFTDSGACSKKFSSRHPPVKDHMAVGGHDSCAPSGHRDYPPAPQAPDQPDGVLLRPPESRSLARPPLPVKRWPSTRACSHASLPNPAAFSLSIGNNCYFGCIRRACRRVSDDTSGINGETNGLSSCF